jgi:hypothetical protein
MMDKVQKHDSSKCNKPFSELFRTDLEVGELHNPTVFSSTEIIPHLKGMSEC